MSVFNDFDLPAACAADFDRLAAKYGIKLSINPYARAKELNQLLEKMQESGEGMPQSWRELMYRLQFDSTSLVSGKDNPDNLGAVSLVEIILGMIGNWLRKRRRAMAGMRPGDRIDSIAIDPTVVPSTSGGPASKPNWTSDEQDTAVADTSRFASVDRDALVNDVLDELWLLTIRNAYIWAHGGRTHPGGWFGRIYGMRGTTLWTIVSRICGRHFGRFWNVSDAVGDTFVAPDATLDDLSSIVSALDLSTLIESDLEWIMNWLLDILAAHEAAAEARSLLAILQNIVDELVRRARGGHRELPVRVHSLDVLGHLGRKLGAMPLVPHGINRRALVESLIALLRSRMESNLRSSAAQALKEFAVGFAGGNPAADHYAGTTRQAMIDTIIAALIKLLEDPADLNHPRRSAVRALEGMILELRAGTGSSKTTLRLDAQIDLMIHSIQARHQDPATPKWLRNECGRALAQIGVA